MIRITAKKDGFRRAGMAHSGTRDYLDDAFTPREVAALKAEPLLVVEEIQNPKQAAPGRGKTAPSGPGKADA